MIRPRSGDRLPGTLKPGTLGGLHAHHPLPEVIGQYEPGDRVVLQLQRGLEEDSVQVKLTAHPEEPGKAYLGIYYETIGEPGLTP